MKINAELVLLGILLLMSVPIGKGLRAQANNQILQAYVLQNKNLNLLEQDFQGRATVLVGASRDLMELNPQQVAKLDLACKGDISRFMQDLTEIDLHTKNFDLQKMAQNQEEMQKVWAVVMPARQRIEQGLHGKGSLFQKTMAALLTAEQQQKHDEHERQKDHRKLIAITKLTLAEFEKKFPLSQKQRQEIMELVDKSPKPKNLGDNTAYYLGIAILAKLPKDELKEILSAEQYKPFEQMIRNGERFGGVIW